MAMASAPREPGWLEKNRGIMTLGNCACACIPACMCAGAHQGKGSWVSWCVTGMGTWGPSSLSRAKRKLGDKEGIETHHEIRASWGKEIPCALRETMLPSARLPSPSSEDFSWLSLKCSRGCKAPAQPNFQQPCGSWASLAALQISPVSRESSCRASSCQPPAASSPGLAVTPYTPVSCHKEGEELTLYKF